MNSVTASTCQQVDSASIVSALKREWEIATAAIKIAEDELALCCDKRILNAGIRARRMMRTAARSLKTCVGLSRRHATAIRVEERAKRNTERASKQSDTV